MWSSLAFWKRKSPKQPHAGAARPPFVLNSASPLERAPSSASFNACGGVISADEPSVPVRRKSSYSTSFIALAKQVSDVIS